MKIKSLLVAFAVVVLSFTACPNNEEINSLPQEKSWSNLDASLSSKTTVSKRNIKKAFSEGGYDRANTFKNSHGLKRFPQILKN